jgi:hypothetical protein
LFLWRFSKALKVHPSSGLKALCFVAVAKRPSSMLEQFVQFVVSHCFSVAWKVPVVTLQSLRALIFLAAAPCRFWKAPKVSLLAAAPQRCSLVLLPFVFAPLRLLSSDQRFWQSEVLALVSVQP